MKRTNIKVIAFDFDGTLVESNQIKDQAFATIFSQWPEHKETMMKWHLARNNVDRQEKMRYFVENILEQLDNIELINELSVKFSKLTLQTIVDCPMVQGAQEFLDDCAGKVPLFLVSATPQYELNKILKKRHMNEYFLEAHGAPINKVLILKKIMADEKASPNEMLYIGDSPEDKQAAMSLGIHFIGKQSDRTLNSTNHSFYKNFIKIKEQFNQHYRLWND